LDDTQDLGEREERETERTDDLHEHGAASLERIVARRPPQPPRHDAIHSRRIHRAERAGAAPPGASFDMQRVPEDARSVLPLALFVVRIVEKS